MSLSEFSVAFRPESQPIKTLEALRDWIPGASPYDIFNIANVPLQAKQASDASGTLARRNYPEEVSCSEIVQSLMMCHDMRGGYQDDKWSQGGQSEDAYRFWHWSLIDSFIYFSHWLVTIPPPGWINAGHLHGVKVLGTFITEWDKGAEICSTILESTASVETYARQLARIAQYFRFDGWLINIENVVEESHVANLVYFLDCLKQALTELTSVHCYIVWYDSVTNKGQLEWQDRLDDKNECFFRSADALFTNYGWKVDSTAPAECAALAGERRGQVYMGIDVYVAKGRGCHGFDSDIPLRAALEGGVSAALFAPAWLYETKQPPSFEAAQEHLWGKLGACLPPARSIPEQAPFYTSFDQGVGASMWIEGRQVSALGWNNLSCQSLQPLRHLTEAKEADESVHVACQVALGRAYEGGASVQLSGHVGPQAHAEVALYQPSIIIPKEKELYVSYSMLIMPGHQVGLKLTMEVMPDGAVQSFLVAPGGFVSLNNQHPLTWASDEARSQGAGGSFSGADDSGSWQVLELMVALPEGKLVGIGLMCWRPESFEVRAHKEVASLQNLLQEVQPGPASSPTSSTPPAAGGGSHTGGMGSLLRGEGTTSKAKPADVGHVVTPEVPLPITGVLKLLGQSGDGEASCTLMPPVLGLLGHIRIATCTTLDCSKSMAVSDVATRDLAVLKTGDTVTVSAVLTWSVKACPSVAKCEGCRPMRFDIYAIQDSTEDHVISKVHRGRLRNGPACSTTPQSSGSDALWIGRAHTETFAVCDLSLTSNCTSIAFAIQAVMLCGARTAIYQTGVQSL